MKIFDEVLKWVMPGYAQAVQDQQEEQTPPPVTQKHLEGKHNQKRHGWRYQGDSLTNARRAMRGQSAEERAEYRKRAGMQEPKKVERPKAPEKKPLPDLKGSEKQIKWANDIRQSKESKFRDLQEKANPVGKKVIDYILNLRSASFWIDYRTVSPADILRSFLTTGISSQGMSRDIMARFSNGKVIETWREIVQDGKGGYWKDYSREIEL